jgi:adenine-specific DNA-methyltransferase
VFSVLVCCWRSNNRVVILMRVCLREEGPLASGPRRRGMSRREFPSRAWSVSDPWARVPILGSWSRTRPLVTPPNVRCGCSMGVRYIGSKARVVDAILDRVGSPSRGDGFFVDAFCGTGVVASRAASQGWPVRLNDHLRCAVVIASADLISETQASMKKLGGYGRAIALLNQAPPERGFIWREYSPASQAHGKPERRYFTEANASKIDAVRLLIREWVKDGIIESTEADLLVSDLLAAANRVANIAGTYGCFLRDWLPSAERPIRLVPRVLRSEPVSMETSCVDVMDVPIAQEDTVYFDPPYTKRQYAAYYHILETIAWGDTPKVDGITGLRPWRNRASAFCYKSRALDALESLISSTPAHRIFLSYSSEGHVPLPELREIAANCGTLTLHELGEIGRYRPNEQASRSANPVTEYLLEIEREESRMVAGGVP